MLAGLVPDTHLPRVKREQMVHVASYDLVSQMAVITMDYPTRGLISRDECGTSGGWSLCHKLTQNAEAILCHRPGLLLQIWINFESSMDK